MVNPCGSGRPVDIEQFWQQAECYSQWSSFLTTESVDTASNPSIGIRYRRSSDHMRTARDSRPDGSLYQLKLERILTM